MIADLVEALLRAWSTKHVVETRQFSLFGIPYSDPRRRIYTAAFTLAYPMSYFDRYDRSGWPS